MSTTTPSREQRHLGLHSLPSSEAVEAVWHRLTCETHLGIPLPPDLRRALEHTLKAPFSSVRVHASTLPQHLNALAFTFGTDIFIQHEMLDFSSPACIALLLHELTHVVQQASHPYDHDMAGRLLTDDTLERQARDNEQLAHAVLSHLADDTQCGDAPSPFGNALCIAHPFIQLSQGWEVELGFATFHAGRLDDEEDYNKTMFRTVGEPRVTATIDHQYRETAPGVYDKRAIIELVTDPIFKKHCFGTNEYTELVKRTRDIATALHQKIGNNVDFTIQQFVDEYNDNHAGDDRLAYAAAYANETFDCAEGIARINTNGFTNFFTQFNGSVRLSALASEQVIEQLATLISIDQEQERLRLSFAAAHAVIGDFNDLDRLRTGRDHLVGLVGIIIYIIRCLVRSKEVLYKNTFGLMPKTSLRRIATKALPKEAQAAIIQLRNDEGFRRRIATEGKWPTDKALDYEMTGGTDAEFPFSADIIIDYALEGDTAPRESDRNHEKYVRDEDTDDELSLIDKVIHVRGKHTFKWSNVNAYVVEDIVLEARGVPGATQQSVDGLMDLIETNVQRFDQAYEL